MIYFRLHVPDTEPEDDTFLTTTLEEVDQYSLGRDDLTLKVTPQQLTDIRKSAAQGTPHVFFRVHHDKAERDPLKGKWYDAEFNEVQWPPKVLGDAGSLILIPVTLDELQLVAQGKS